MSVQILIVDDDKTFVYGMKEFLKLRNVPAITARSASEAIKLLSEEDISLVCTDWDLGDSTGLDVLSYAKDKDIPCVFLTVHDEDSYKEKALSLGAVRYYIKGVMPYGDIINDMKRLLDEK